MSPSRRSTQLLTALIALAGAAILIVVLLLASGKSAGDGLSGNPDLDPGTSLSGPAPDFTLKDESGRPVSLRQFRGKVVLLAFNDSQCTTICPLTTTAMQDAQAMLGPAAREVQLLGIDANPQATSLRDVRSYTELHGLSGRWSFLTGSLPQLKRVWKAYKIDVAIERGQIDHTPALFVIDTRGRLARLYLTQQSYAAVRQLGQLLARESASLLPGHPAVRSHASLAHVQGISPATTTSLSRQGGGTLRLGPAGGARLLLFFATWDQEVGDLRRQLEGLNRYAGSAAKLGLPPLAAVDEASVEPGPATLAAFLGTLARPLAYPLATDQTGRVADGYGVQDEPWLVLTSARGQILWSRDVATDGWPSLLALQRTVRAALTRAPGEVAGGVAARRALAGSPPALDSLHAQAGQLLGDTAALAARLKALRGYPVVINAWASWCPACKAEFNLFRQASLRYGRRVAFLGADTSDAADAARSFLAGHPVSYPSYQTTIRAIGKIVPQGIVGLPTTVFVSPAGKIDVHTGEYDVQTTLDSDIQTYALGGSSGA